MNFRFLLILIPFITSFSFGFDLPRFFAREIPEEIQLLNGTPAGEGESLGTLVVPPLKIFSHPDGTVSMTVSGAAILSHDGMPQIPRIYKRLEVSPQEEVTAFLENIKIEESSVSIPLAFTGESMAWEPKHNLSFGKPQNQGRFYPGKFIQSHQVGGQLYVNLFPVQIDLHTGKVLKVITAELKLKYADKHVALEFSEIFSKPSVIVTSNRLKSAAMLLKDYHESTLGIKTEVVTVEEIESTEKAIDEAELPAGYKNLEKRDDFILPYDAKTHTGYDYLRARKLSHYLQGRMGQGGTLKYVTLLGGVNDVPPSYYVWVRSPFGKNIAPTDHCYGALSQCLEPKVAVGRLPFEEEGQIKSYLSKIERWRYFAETSPSEVALYGGKAFPRSDIYVGEVATLNVIKSPLADFRGVQKFFKTKQNYHKESLMKLVDGQVKSSFAYYLDHGTGNQWYTEQDFISSKEVLEAQPPKVWNPSLVVSIACTNAASDESLIKSSVYAPAKYGKGSIGVALLQSKAGAVAYLGVNRPSIGMPVYRFDEQANMDVSGSTYGLQIMDSFFSKYNAIKKGRLGDYSLRALQAFNFENGNDLKVEQNLWSYFITQLLGDPVIPLPTRRKTEANFEIGKSLTLFDTHSGFGLPILHIKNSKSVEFELAAAIPVEVTLLKILRSEFGGFMGEEVLASVTSQSNNIKIPVDINEQKLSEGTYLIKIENKTGVPRERHILFSATND